MGARGTATVQTGQQGQQQGLQVAFASGGRIGAVGARYSHRNVEFRQHIGQMLCHRLPQTVGGHVDGLRVWRMARIMQALGDIVLTGRAQGQRAEGRIKAVIAQHGAQRVQIGRVDRAAAQRHLHEGLAAKGAP